ncbi:hypothetical protein BpHYR1_017933 [Brachionus plicatilis]|uniref:Uncharacterized protein n=1 Tax=Brachionus plicatilis TaxID=10195 RepID=A0A3M7PUS5_BRAPC|nr:hypothetical protein BpHYR1_017933 [Brachionus plicatilis]
MYCNCPEQIEQVEHVRVIVRQNLMRNTADLITENENIKNIYDCPWTIVREGYKTLLIIIEEKANSKKHFYKLVIYQLKSLKKKTVDFLGSRDFMNLQRRQTRILCFF